MANNIPVSVTVSLYIYHLPKKYILQKEGQEGNLHITIWSLFFFFLISFSFSLFFLSFFIYLFLCVWGVEGEVLPMPASLYLVPWLYSHSHQKEEITPQTLKAKRQNVGLAMYIRCNRIMHKTHHHSASHATLERVGSWRHKG